MTRHGATPPSLVGDVDLGKTVVIRMDATIQIAAVRQAKSTLGLGATRTSTIRLGVQGGAGPVVIRDVTGCEPVRSSIPRTCSFYLGGPVNRCMISGLSRSYVGIFSGCIGLPKNLIARAFADSSSCVPWCCSRARNEPASMSG